MASYAKETVILIMKNLEQLILGGQTLTEPGDCCSILDSKSRSIHMIILVEPISIAVHRATRQQPDNEQRLLGSNLSELGHNSLFIDLNLVFTYHHL